MFFPRNKNVIWFLLCVVALHLTACAELEKPPETPFYGTVAPPAAREFRWSNGALPKTFDPAFAASPSETASVRATFEGLTEWHEKTLEPAPAVASNWDASEDFRTWTFHLRPNAVWSNGKKVTAADFVRSWERIVKLREKSPHAALFANLVGAKPEIPKSDDEEDPIPANLNQPNAESIQNPKSKIQNETWFGAEAVDDATLRVWLIEPDAEFPKLVAHSAFRPIFGDGNEFQTTENAAKIISNGAFRFAASDKNGVVLERGKNYWNAEKVNLDRVKLVPAANDETALKAYQAGEVDVVTNTHLEPLAFKLLASYEDFRQEKFNSVTFYEFNPKSSNVADRRVREALTLAVDRERLTKDELDGASVPANDFLPDSDKGVFKFNANAAKKLFAEAGFPDGKDFPRLKLLINRTDSAKRIARAVAAQWRKILNIEIDIVTSSADERKSNDAATEDFDLVRRTIVLPTTNETSNLSAMFSRAPSPTVTPQISPQISPSPIQTPPNPFENPSLEPSPSPAENPSGIEFPPKITNSTLDFENENSSFFNRFDNSFDNANAEIPPPFASEAQAVAELPAIPLYFPASYALVKPYVKGFESNLLNAPALQNISIEADWQSK